MAATIQAPSRLEDFLHDLSALNVGKVRSNEPLRNWTTFHCVAHAAAIVSPENESQLSDLVGAVSSYDLEWGTEWTLIGRGSNLLVRDGGYPGVLIDLSEGFKTIQVIGEDALYVFVRVGAGVPMGTLLQWTRDEGYSGFGFSFGIPGSIGGGVRMNAGTPLGTFSDVLVQVGAMDLLGNRVVKNVTKADFIYRDFPKGRNLLILEAVFRLRRATGQKVELEIEAAKEKRKNQPLELPNIGSVFKNPPGDFAGRLVERAGLRGTRIGDAQISPKHGNWIVNLGAATTSDTLKLIQDTQSTILEKFGVKLEPEVHVIGVDS